jgi:type IV secretory pathway VirJ component
MAPSVRLSLRAALALLTIASSQAGAQGSPAEPDDLNGLPVVEVRAKVHADVLAIFLSGDGGWADIDKQIGHTLAEKGVDVVGFDDRAYLRSGRRDADGTASDVARVATHFMRAWGNQKLIILGYSRGAAFAPFVVTRLSPALKERVALVAMLGLPEHVSYKYRFSDLWATRTRAEDPLILPELEKLKGTNMMCIFGKEEDESLCRSIDPALVFPIGREGGHHFDGDYRALTDLILARMESKAP